MVQWMPERSVEIFNWNFLFDPPEFFFYNICVEYKMQSPKEEILTGFLFQVIEECWRYQISNFTQHKKNFFEDDKVEAWEMTRFSYKKKKKKIPFLRWSEKRIFVKSFFCS